MEINISKGIFKKSLALTMALLIALSGMWTGLATVSFAAGDNDIEVNQYVTVEVEEGQLVYLKFTPAYSAGYRFYSVGEYDTYGYLYDEDMFEITSNDDADEGDRNFVIEYSLEKDKTYYWGVRHYSSEASGCFSVRLEFFECPHLNKIQVDAVPVTCTTDGYTSGEWCNDCSCWISGHETIPASHFDENNDSICERCEKKIPVSEGACGGHWVEVEYDSDGYDGAVKYSLYADGTLEIYGEGEIAETPFCDNMEYSRIDPYSVKTVIIHEGITKIGERAFSGCGALTSVTIPDSVTEIGQNAFDECASLETVVIPESVTEIGEVAFAECASLESVVIPDGVTEIGAGTFYGCESLESIVIPDSVTEIGEDAFCGCASLETVVVPDGVTEIGAGTFYGCESLKSIVIPDGVTEIGEYTFSGCASLESVVIPDSVTEIGALAFARCASLESVVIPDSVTEIGREAFARCASLESIVIPDGVPEIGEYTFYECASLESIVIPDSVTEIGEVAFEGCASLESVVIPDSVTEIGADAFYRCINLKNIEFNEGLEEIGDNAFFGCCFLKEINLPSTVRSIGADAFGECIYLEEVTFPETMEMLDYNAFTDCIRLSKITVLNPDCQIKYAPGSLSENAVIYGYSGSTAEKFAKDWLFKFVPLDKEHDHEYELKLGALPSCYEKGYLEYNCYCGDRYEMIIPTVNHFDGDGDGLCDYCNNEPDNGSTEVKPDEPTETPDEGDNGENEAPEVDVPETEDKKQENIFTSFFNSIIDMFRKLLEIFNIFKK